MIVLVLVIGIQNQLFKLYSASNKNCKIIKKKTFIKTDTCETTLILRMKDNMNSVNKIQQGVVIFLK